MATIDDFMKLDIRVGTIISAKDFVKANGGEIVTMIRYEVGEGIEKKQENFAEEVMSQING